MIRALGSLFPLRHTRHRFLTSSSVYKMDTGPASLAPTMTSESESTTAASAKREIDGEVRDCDDVAESSKDVKRAKLGHDEEPMAEVLQSDSGSIIIVIEKEGERKRDSQEDDKNKNRKGKKGCGSEKKRGKEKEWVGRNRRGTRPDKPSEEGGEGEGGGEGKEPRLPKRQCALLIGFCGSGYRGMQIQPDGPTIEGVLFKALVAAGAVSKDNADDPVKVGLQRAARTDAGVHAAGNVVSMKIIPHVPGVPDLVKRVNEELPPEIRLWSFQRVQNSFNARMSCDSRRYTYFFPSYMLIPPKPTSALYQSIHRQSLSETTTSTNTTMVVDTNTTTIPTQPEHGADAFWQNVELDKMREEGLIRKREWRVSKGKVEALREAAKRFEGTHNFYNFTVGRDVKDKSCMRHMKKIEVADPVVYGGTEWISVMLHGQSFMLHQIRKMMCVLVTAVRTGTPSSIINALYGKPLVAIPKMPSLGLLLENPIFDSYNKRVENANEQNKLNSEHPDYRAPISFDQHWDEMQKFKEEYVYSRMRESEDKLHVFDRWQIIFDKYNGPDLLYFNTRGTIPEAAIIKKGESRPNPFCERRRFDLTDFVPIAAAADGGGGGGGLVKDVESLMKEEDGEDEGSISEENMGKKELEEAEG